VYLGDPSGLGKVNFSPDTGIAKSGREEGVQL